MLLCKSTTQTSPTKSNIIIEQQTSAKRVVALSSLAADIISQLDRTKLVGISGSSLLKNDSILQGITRITEGQNAPNLERIVFLRAHLVIAATGFSNVRL